MKKFEMYYPYVIGLIIGAIIEYNFNYGIYAEIAFIGVMLFTSLSSADIAHNISMVNDKMICTSGAKHRSIIYALEGILFPVVAGIFLIFTNASALALALISILLWFRIHQIWVRMNKIIN